tara:strand:+ start:461 stop:2260 length:1800 start_codon:yes stop_codon:yes gene_type:complete
VRFGSFEILEEVARGGMGVVYRARWSDIQQVVALKIMLQPSETRALRFVREARALEALDHPNVVKVHGVGVLQGVPWIAMELLEGESLQARLDRAGAWEPVAAARLVAELADAIQHCHDRGILHRDLKPDNVILSGLRGVLVDFGLVKELGRLGETERLSQTGALLGTPGYCSPEHLRGDSAAVGAASDIYGLGAILYGLLTREAPVRGATFLEVVMRTETHRPDPTRTALDAVCLRCLEKDPAARFASAAELALALRGDWANTPPQTGLPGRLAVSLFVLVIPLGIWLALAEPNSDSRSLAVSPGDSVAAASPTLPRLQPSASASPLPIRPAITGEALRRSRLLYNRGNKRSSEGDRVGALADYSEAIQIDPDYVKAYYNRAVERREGGDHDGAIADNTKAIELDPSHADAFYNRGCSKLALRDYEGSEADFSRAVELEPDDSRHYNNRAFVRLRLGDYQGCLADSTRSLALDPKNASALYNRAHVRRLLKDFEGAIADCTEWLSLSKGPQATRARVFHTRGLIKGQSGDRAGALEDFGEAIRLAPTFARAYGDRGTLLRAQGKHRLAARDLERFRELAPEVAKTLGFDLDAYLAEHR